MKKSHYKEMVSALNAALSRVARDYVSLTLKYRELQNEYKKLQQKIVDENVGEI